MGHPGLPGPPANTVGTCDYEPFGEAQSDCSALGTAYRFTGKQHDTESGLYHFWFRQYDAAQGRWMAVDPLFGDANVPQSLNRFAYVAEDPVNHIDPQGLCFIWQRYRFNERDYSWVPNGIEVYNCFFGFFRRVPSLRPLDGPEVSNGKVGASQNPPAPPPGCPSALRSKITEVGLKLAFPELGIAVGEAQRINGVVQLSLSVSGTLMSDAVPIGGSGQVSAGLVVDPRGNIGLALSYGYGLGVGEGVVGGLTASESPRGKSIRDVAGPAKTAGFAFANGYGGGYELSSNAGFTRSGTVGVGVGGFGFASLDTNTTVIPLVCH